MFCGKELELDAGNGGHSGVLGCVVEKWLFGFGATTSACWKQRQWFRAVSTQHDEWYHIRTYGVGPCSVLSSNEAV